MQRARTHAPLLALSTLAALGLAAALPQAAHAQSLTTMFSSNNGQNGNMFDIVANKSITVNSFDINLQAGQTVPVSVYIKSGTYAGSANNSAVWTLLGTQTVTSAGDDKATHLNLGGFTITSGTSDGVYITTTSGGTILNYTDGNTDYSNADLTVTHGIGIAYAFGSTFSPRIWNGTVYYSPAVASTVPEPSSVAAFAFTALGAAALLLRARRRTATFTD